MSLRLRGVEGVSDVTLMSPNGKVNPPPISLIKLREELIRCGATLWFPLMVE